MYTGPRTKTAGHDEPHRAGPPAGAEHGERQRHEHHAIAQNRQQLTGEQQPKLRFAAKNPWDNAPGDNGAHGRQVTAALRASTRVDPWSRP
jgi:hypothetical protein